MTLRVCAEPRCPVITDQRRCPQHRSQYEKARGTRQQRGYDNEHDRLRAWWAPKVRRGTVPCARCGELIAAGERWALDHNDDRTAYLGPSHERCNNSAGGQAAHKA